MCAAWSQSGCLLQRTMSGKHRESGADGPVRSTALGSSEVLPATTDGNAGTGGTGCERKERWTDAEVLDLEAIHPKSNRTEVQPKHELYPHLLRKKATTGTEQV